MRLQILDGLSRLLRWLTNSVGGCVGRRLGVPPVDIIYPEPGRGEGQDAGILKGQGQGSLFRRRRAGGDIIWIFWPLLGLAAGVDTAADVETSCSSAAMVVVTSMGSKDAPECGQEDAFANLR